MNNKVTKNNGAVEKIVAPLINASKVIYPAGSLNRTIKGLRFLLYLFLIISIFYGLVWIPSQQLNIESSRLNLAQKEYLMNMDMAKLGLTKIQNSCQLIAQNSTDAYIKKSSEKITDEQKQKLVGQFFANCLFAEGLQMQDNKANKGTTKK